MPRIEGPRTFLSAPSSRQAGAGPPGGGALGTGVFLFLITHKQGAVAGSGCSLSFARLACSISKQYIEIQNWYFPKALAFFIMILTYTTPALIQNARAGEPERKGAQFGSGV